MAAPASKVPKMIGTELKVSEHDEAGKLTATYVWSSGGPTQESGRIDFIVSSLNDFGLSTE